MPIDANDKKTGWTSQQGSLADVDPEVNEPGMVYHRSQLPDPDVARAAGFATQPEPEVVFDDEAEAVAQPNGPTPDELHWKDVVDEVKDDVKDVEDAVTGKKDEDDNKDNDVEVVAAPTDAPAAADAPVEDKPVEGTPAT